MNISENEHYLTAAHAMLALICFFLFAGVLGILTGMAAPAPVLDPAVARAVQGHIPGGEAGVDTAPERPLAAVASWRGPRLAVVIDDVGHRTDILRALLALNRPLTFAVLPDVPGAAPSAALIERAGREYIIHAPMEPFDYPRQHPGPQALMRSQSLAEAARRMARYLAVLPGASGVSNHMGSAFTGDPARMNVVLAMVKARKLFFLNSRTSNTRVPRLLAGRHGVPYLERDVFLDHDPAPEAIEAAWEQAVAQARRRGWAVAIGHPYPQTHAMLRRNLPRMRGGGVRLVTLSRLFRP